MAGSALSIDRNGAFPPVGRGLPAMTFDAGAGAIQIVSGWTALGTEAGRKTKINLGIMRSSQMADETAVPH